MPSCSASIGPWGEAGEGVAIWGAGRLPATTFPEGEAGGPAVVKGL